MAEGASITQLLASWSEGNAAALDALTPLVHQELRRCASNYLRRGRRNQTLQPTALVNEAGLRFDRSIATAALREPGPFLRHRRTINAPGSGGLCPGTQGRLSSVGARQNVSRLEEVKLLSPGRAPDVLEVSEALEQLAMVDERKAKVIELRYFGGMDREEIAIALAISRFPP